MLEKNMNVVYTQRLAGESLQDFIDTGMGWIGSWFPQHWRETTKATFTYCLDQTASFLAAYGKDLPAQTTLPLAWQVNYGDPDYWNAHFNDSAEELLKNCETLQPSELIQYLPHRLADLQSLIGPRMVSPLDYTDLLKKISRLLPNDEAVLSLVEEQTLVLAARMQSDQKNAKACFDQDLSSFLQDKKLSQRQLRKAERVIRVYGRWIALPGYAVYLKNLAAAIAPSQREAFQQKLNQYYVQAMEQQARDKQEPVFVGTLSEFDNTEHDFGSSVGSKQQEETAGLQTYGALGLLGMLGTAYWANEWMQAPTAWKTVSNVAVSSLISYQQAQYYPAQSFLPILLGSLSTLPTVSTQGDLAPPGPRGTEFQVNTQTSFDQNYPNIAGLADGGFVVVWENSIMDSGIDSYSAIKAQIYSASGVKKGDEINLNLDQSGVYLYAAVSAFSWGGFVITYDSQNVSLQIFSAMGRSFQARYTVQWGGRSFVYSNVAVLSDDTFVVVWSGYLSGKGGIYGCVFDLNNTFGVLPLTEAFLVGASRLVPPGISALHNGGFAVTWYGEEVFSQNVTQTNVFVRCYDATFQPVSDIIPVNERPLIYPLVGISYLDQPSIAVLDNGLFMIGWARLDFFEYLEYGAYVRQFTEYCQPVGPAFSVDNLAPASPYYPLSFTPALAALDAHRFAVIWQSAAANAIYGRIYDNNQTLLVSDFAINQFPLSFNLRYVICALRDGGFAAVWDNTNQDGSGYGIFGQRYDNQYQPIDVEYSLETPVNWNNDHDQNATTVAALTDGDYIVVWENERIGLSYSDIYGQLYFNHGEIKVSQFLLEPLVVSYQYSPRVIALPDNQFAVFWIERLNDTYQPLKGKRYNALGEPQTDTWVISDQLLFRDEKLHYSASAFVTGNMIIVWEAPADVIINNQSTNCYSIWGRLYDRQNNNFSDIFSIASNSLDDVLTFENPTVVALENDSFAVSLLYAPLQNTTGRSTSLIVCQKTVDSLEWRANVTLNRLAYSSLVSARPSIALLANQSLIVYWNEYTAVRHQNQTANCLGSFMQVYRQDGQPAAPRITTNIDYCYFEDLVISGKVIPIALEHIPNQIIVLSNQDLILTSYLKEGLESEFFSSTKIAMQRFNYLGTLIGDMQPVSWFAGGSQNFSDAAPLSDGGFVVVWESLDQDSSSRSRDLGIFLLRYNQLGYIQPVQSGFKNNLVNFNVTRSQILPIVLSIGKHGFMVVWSGWNGEYGYDIYGTRYELDGKKTSMQADIAFTPNMSSDQEDVHAVQVDENSIVLCWNDMSDVGIHMQKYDLQGTPQSSIGVINQGKLGILVHPAMAIKDQTILIVWMSLSVDYVANVKGQFFDVNLSSQGSEFLISYTIPDSYQLSPQVCGLTNGDFAVLWIKVLLSDNSNSQLFSRVLHKTGQWVTEPFLVTSSESVEDASYFCCSRNEGGFALVWTEYGVEMHLQVFNQDYLPIRNDTKLSFGTSYSGELSLGLIPSLDNSRFFLIWAHNQEEFSEFGFRRDIYGQFFDEMGDMYSPPIVLDVNPPGQVNSFEEEDSIFLRSVYSRGYSTSFLINHQLVMVWDVAGQDDPEDSVGYGVYLQQYFPNLTINQHVDSMDHGLAKRICITSNDQTQPVLSTNGQHLVIAWTDSHLNTSSVIQWQSYDIAGQLLSFAHASFTTIFQQHPQLLSLSKQETILWWEQQDDSFTNRYILASIFSVDGTILLEQFPLAKSSLINQKDADILLYNQHLMMAWECQLPEVERICIQDIFSNDPVVVIDSDAQTYHRLPKIGIFKNQTLTIWWSKVDTSIDGYDIFYTRLVVNETGFFSGSITGYIQNNYDDLYIIPAFMDENHTMLVYQNDGGDGWYSGIAGILNNQQESIFAKEVKANINIQFIQEQVNPDIAVLREGNVIIVWQDNYYATFSWDIYCRLYDRELNPINQQQRVNPYQWGDQIKPQVRALPDGGFIVVWQSQEFNKKQVVFGQRFDRLLNAVSWEQSFYVSFTQAQHLIYTEDQPSWLPLLSSYSPHGDVTVALIFSNPKAGILQINAESNPGVTFGVVTTLNETAEWQMSGYFNDINNAWKTLQLVPTTNFNQSFSIAFRAQDATAFSPIYQVQVEGIPVNDAPFILGSQIKAQYIEIGKVFTLNLAPYFYDVDDSVLHYRLGDCAPLSDYFLNGTTCQELSIKYVEDEGDIGSPCSWLTLTGDGLSVLTGQPPYADDWCIVMQALDAQNASAIAGVEVIAEDPNATDHLSTTEIAGIAVGTAAASLLGLLLTYKARQKYQEDTDETRGYKAGLIQQSANTELADLRQYYLPSITRAALTGWGQSYLFYNPPSEEAVEDADSTWQPSVYISAAADDTEGREWSANFLIPHLEQLGFRVYFGQAHREQVTTYVVVIPSSGYSQWYNEAENESAVIEAALHRARLDRRDVRCGDGSAVLVVLPPNTSYAREMLPEILHRHEGDAIPQRRVPLFTIENATENMAVLFSLLKRLAPEMLEKIQNTENRFYNHAAQVNRRTRQTIEREIRMSTRGGRENATVEGTFALESSQSSIAAEQTLPITGNQRQSHNPAFSGFPFSFFRKERSSLADERVPLLAKENNVSEVDYSLTLE